MAKDVATKRTYRQKRTSEQIATVVARRGLTVHQRLAIHALVMTTTRTEALTLMRGHGIQVDKATLNRWFLRADFQTALKAAEAVVAESITKHSVLRKSEAVLDKAMEGTPILGYIGKDEQEIVGYKPDLPTAARVVEMQGRAVGLFQDESATKIAVLVDIDFSGRKDAPVLEAEVVDVKPARPVKSVEDDELADDDLAVEEPIEVKLGEPPRLPRLQHVPPTAAELEAAALEVLKEQEAGWLD